VADEEGGGAGDSGVEGSADGVVGAVVAGAGAGAGSGGGEEASWAEATRAAKKSGTRRNRKARDEDMGGLVRSGVATGEVRGMAPSRSDPSNRRA
jgi:hypothetical protein